MTDQKYMGVGGEASSRILLELMTGKEPEKPDTPEEAAHRRELAESIRKIHAEGGTVQLPQEWP